MTTQPFWRIITAVVVLGVLRSSAVDAEECNELLHLGYTNVYHSVSKHDSIVSSFRSFCSENYHSNNTTEKAQVSGAFTYLKLNLPISFSADFGSGSIEETRSKFCDLGWTNSQYRDFESITSIEIHDRALVAWEHCLNLKTPGLKTDIRFTPDVTAITVDLSWTGLPGAEFSGIDQPGLGKAACKATIPDAPKAIPVTPNTRFPLTPEVVTISCTRRFTLNADQESSADRARLTFKTNSGSFDVDLPPITLRQMSCSEIDGIYKLIEELRDQISDLRKCPVGFLDAGTYCIEQQEHSTDRVDWITAASACAADGYQLCSSAQWGAACENFSDSEIQGKFDDFNGEWVDDRIWASGGSGDRALGMGPNNPQVTLICDMGIVNDKTTSLRYRCCVEKVRKAL